MQGLKYFFYPLFILLIYTGLGYSQGMHHLRNLTTALGYTARSFLLSANRPTYSVSAYMTEKKKVNLYMGLSFDNDYVEFPVYLDYGISNSVNLFGAIPIYTQAYNFRGDKVEGIGDAQAGVKFKLQESNYFIHAFQFAIKIPTASSAAQLGTGKVDFHFGLGEGFYSGGFGYELTGELNLLRKRDFPNTTNITSLLLSSAIDSLKSVYDYKFEPEMVLSFTPSFDISQRTEIYGGVVYARNFRLDYDSAQLFTGLGYYFTDEASVNAGVSFGILNEPNWLFSAGINLIL